MVLFTLGLLMALLDFWVVSKGYFKRGADCDSRAHAVRISSTWSEYIAAEPTYIDKGKRWFTAGEWIGWMSAISALSGGIALGIRSAERRVGKQCVSTCRSRLAP